MTMRRAYLGFITLLIGLFLAFQISAAAHATSFGDDPHEHEGMSCVVTTMAETDQGVLPVEPETVAIRVNMAFEWEEIFVSFPVSTQPARAPPPRGPPSTFQ